MSFISDEKVESVFGVAKLPETSPVKRRGYMRACLEIARRFAVPGILLEDGFRKLRAGIFCGEGFAP